MPIPKPAYDLVLVRWWDHANALHCWADVSEVGRLKDGCFIETCGWVIKEDKKWLFLAFSVVNHSGQTKGKTSDDVSDVIVIFKKCIESRTLIRKGR